MLKPKNLESGLKMPSSISLDPPDHFRTDVKVSGCFCESDNRILLLQRKMGKSQGGTWCLPSGKLEANESPEQAAIREVLEETGIILQPPLQSVGHLFIHYDGIDYIFYMFYQQLSSLKTVILEVSAFDNARWVAIEEAFKLPLIFGGTEVIQAFQNWKKDR